MQARSLELHDGIEVSFHVNHVAHQLLTLRLLDLLEKNSPSRVVVVSSAAHLWAPPTGVPLTMEGINNPKHVGATQYGITKLANILFSQELSERVQDKEIYVNSIHPGLVASDFVRTGEETTQSIVDFVKNALTSSIFHSVSSGALTQLYAASSPEIEKYNIRGMYFEPIATPISSPHLSVGNSTERKLLWKFTQQLIAERIQTK